MRRYSPKSFGLAWRLLADEADRGEGPPDVAGDVERFYQKMCQQIAKSIGPEGCNVLFARALEVTKDEFPFLDGVKVELQGESRLKGLRECVQGRDSTEVSHGVAAFLASFISLLIGFIGPSLTLRQVQQAYPVVPLDDVGFSSEEAKE